MRRRPTIAFHTAGAASPHEQGWTPSGWLPAGLRAIAAVWPRAGLSLAQHPLIGAFLLLSALTALITWPQVVYLSSRVAAHDDPYLSMWRLSWIAHLLPGRLADLPDANIFHPSPGTFAYTDMTLLEGVLAAPWLWAGVNPVLVYNVSLLGGMVASGLGMFVLVRHLAKSDHAALVSAVIFTIAPYRIEHIVHLELQWTMWMPLAFWAMHRTFETGSLRHGALVGVFLSLQLLSCVYYGAFLGILIALLTLLLAVWQPRRIRCVIAPLALGVAIPAVTAWIYARPYVDNARLLGTRDPDEVASYSARLLSYVTAPELNLIWGATADRFVGDELHLFMGLVATALAVVGVVTSWSASRPVAWIYLALLMASVELSLGLNGTVYTALYRAFFALQGFRAPARFAILAVAALAVLAGFGFRYLEATTKAHPLGRALLVVVLVAIGFEYGSAPARLERVPDRPPDLYRYLKALEPGAVLEIPIKEPAPVYMYWSKEHWYPLVNGYSGHASPTYGNTLERLEWFPDTDSIELLRELQVRYVVIHQSYYPETRYTQTLLELMQSSDFVSLGRYRDWAGNAEVFGLKARD